jgi:hypothetical protein
MANGQQSPVKSPTSPQTNGYAIEEFSPEFLRLYRQPDPQPIDSNLYADIRIADEIFTWLKDREKLADATNGMEPGQVFQRVEKSIEELDELAPVITKRTEEAAGITVHGVHPKWEYLTVESPVAKGSYIGELKGQIGKKADYLSDTSNRWDLLQHPEPFVFFPPYLPIYIDARREGTILRYTRRSCNPNIAIKIFTQSPELGCHFCFIATDDIQPGEELTIGWEISTEIRTLLLNSVTNGDLRKEGFKKVEHFSNWVACVLANFGGCACDPNAPHKGRECLLARARPNINHLEPIQNPNKPTKGRKKKAQISPLSTGHAVNSRANSEFNRDAHDEEHADMRSTSGSTRSKPGSRDNTPGTHFSMDGIDIKNSDREKRKLQQQERLFEQLEYDEQHGGKRRKRNSGGSNLNTPTTGTVVSCRPRRSHYVFRADLETQKQLGHPDPFPPTTSTHKHRASNAFNSRKPVGVNGSRGSSSKTNSGSAMRSPKPRPVYTDASTQTESMTHASPPMSPALNQTPTQPPMSFKRKLLLQAKEERLQREKRRSVKREKESPALQDVTERTPVVPSAPSASDMDIEPVESKEALTTATTEQPAGVSRDSMSNQPAQREDVEMKDADAPVTIPLRPSPKAETPPATHTIDNPTQASHPPIQPPPPPWSSVTSQTQTTPQQNQRPVDLAIQLPPTPDFSSNTHTLATPLVATPGSVNSAMTGGSLAQSPSSLQPATALVSPSMSTAITPGPTRKKFSLSDYMSRKKKIDQKVDQEAHSTSQASASPPTALSVAYQAASPSAVRSASPLNHDIKVSDTGPTPMDMSTTDTAATTEDTKAHPPPPLFQPAT